LFVLALVSLTGSFIILLREVFLATEFQDILRQRIIRDNPP
jgi:hypothetical protein